MPRSDEHARRRPTVDRVDELAGSLGFSLSDRERTEYHRLVDDAIGGLEDLDHAPRFDPELRPETLDGRERGYRPGPDEDPFNAWITKCTVQGAADGPLSDVTVGVKDSIALAGYEMTAGSTVLEGFVPQIDATVVSRVLERGATVVGKLNMESFAWSGRGDVSDFGQVTNPHDEDHLPGGSSSGAGVAPATGDCDVALGTDQAGSVRIPSSWCGIVGLKPTHGLVPYTGALPLEPTVDHIGPMAPTVDLVARGLEAIAGIDRVDGIGLDQRQPVDLETEPYTDAVGSSIENLSIGVLEEGFGWEASDPVVDETVRTAVDRFEELGVTSESVSVPVHRQGVSAWAAIATQGGARMLEEGGVGTAHEGWSWTRLARELDTRLESRADDLPPTVKRSRLAASFLAAEYGVEPYSSARNVAMAARTAYDDALSSYDALALPTTIVRPFKKPEAFDRVEWLSREVLTIFNTCPFNITGHPALSIPCGKPDGLPVGLMLVGSHFDERTLLALGSHLETVVDWDPSP